MQSWDNRDSIQLHTIYPKSNILNGYTVKYHNQNIIIDRTQQPSSDFISF